MKKVYVPMAVDLFHHGHLNIIQEAKKLGKVIVGILTVIYLVVKIYNETKK